MEGNDWHSLAADMTIYLFLLFLHVISGSCELLVHSLVGLGHLESSYVSHDCVLFHHVHGDYHGQHAVRV